MKRFRFKAEPDFGRWAVIDTLTNTGIKIPDFLFKDSPAEVMEYIETLLNVVEAKREKSVAEQIAERELQKSNEGALVQDARNYDDPRYLWPRYGELHSSVSPIHGDLSQEVLRIEDNTPDSEPKDQTPLVHREPNQNDDGTIGDTGRFL